MTPAAWELELKKRGFVFNASCDQWYGPFGLTVSGALNGSDVENSHRQIDHAFARVNVLRQIDEQLRAKRGLPRPPLVEPVDPNSNDFQPFKVIPRPSI